jgi:hypothetical protein
MILHIAPKCGHIEGSQSLYSLCVMYKTLPDADNEEAVLYVRMPYFVMIHLQCWRKACVVYGALLPEMWRMQARLMKDLDSGYNVLVACSNGLGHATSLKW